MKALIIVDVQKDFMPGGALGVPDADLIIPVINEMMAQPFDLIVATKDWHPPNHASFASHYKGKKPGDHVKLDGMDQILWPDHCVQNTVGSDFAPGLDITKLQGIFYKGTDKKVDSYSAFFDNAHKVSTGLAEFLKEHDVDSIYIAGLATDYCVKYSVLDAAHLGFKPYVIIDACGGINLNPNDVENAILEMKDAGAIITHSPIRK